MARSVQLSDDAYATLKALKMPGESFSDTVKRLAASRKDPRALLRLSKLRPLKGYDYEVARKRMNDADRARLAKRLGIPLRDADEE